MTDITRRVQKLEEAAEPEGPPLFVVVYPEMSADEEAAAVEAARAKAGGRRVIIFRVVYDDDQGEGDR